MPCLPFTNASLPWRLDESVVNRFWRLEWWAGSRECRVTCTEHKYFSLLWSLEGLGCIHDWKKWAVDDPCKRIGCSMKTIEQELLNWRCFELQSICFHPDLMLLNSEAKNFLSPIFMSFSCSNIHHVAPQHVVRMRSRQHLDVGQWLHGGSDTIFTLGGNAFGPMAMEEGRGKGRKKIN